NVRSSDLSRLSDASKRSTFAELFHLFFVKTRRDQRCPDRAGSHSVYANILFCQSLGKRAGESDDGSFGSGIIDKIPFSFVGGDRGRVDNRTSRRQMGKSCFRQKEMGKNIYPECLRQLFFRNIQNAFL